MLMNYHEMTMNEPRDSPQRRKQFLVICTVMAGCLGHTVWTSGGLSSVDVAVGKFPGGTFVYKFASRDYAASASLVESIAADVGFKHDEDPVDALYTLYLDDPNRATGRRQRFASGLLEEGERTMAEKQQEDVAADGNNDDGEKVVSGDEGSEATSAKVVEDTETTAPPQEKAKSKEKEAGKQQKQQQKERKRNRNDGERLLALNRGIIPPTAEDERDLAVIDLWKRLPYSRETLPAAKAAVVQFPFTNGFVSALILSYKVIPALRRYIQNEKKKDDDNGKDDTVPIDEDDCGKNPVVLTTCSVPDQMCTHYAPLERCSEFFLGRRDAQTYLQEMGPEPFVDWEGMKSNLLKMIPFRKRMFKDGGSNDEL